MKTLILALALTIPLAAETPPVQEITVKTEVPSPAWNLAIESIHKKDGKLLVVTRASKSEGIFTQQITTAKASAKLPNKIADIPREIYLLDATWKTPEHVHAVTQEELDTILAGSTQIYKVKTEIASADFLELSLEEAEELAKKNGLKYRIVEVDGQPRPITMDLRMDRFNFHVENGKIVKVTKG
ncbi:hypothetical protein ACFPK9_15500 [Rubritalea spongiae]|uniref:PepSY domain-containing protein n=1 Tax=Rubritalea spongiae TaxID=430797 RepID=A0ABW5E0J4_9BACT